MLLTYEGEAAGNYYYSTSCGAGTDVISWQGGNGEPVPYLQGGRVSALWQESAASGGFDAEALRDEGLFRQFIIQVHEEDLEKTSRGIAGLTGWKRLTTGRLRPITGTAGKSAVLCPDKGAGRLLCI